VTTRPMHPRDHHLSQEPDGELECDIQNTGMKVLIRMCRTEPSYGDCTDADQKPDRPFFVLGSITNRDAEPG
jgi:hypothetical protein